MSSAAAAVPSPLRGGWQAARLPGGVVADRLDVICAPRAAFADPTRPLLAHPPLKGEGLRG